ncbi:DnaJ domain containing protein [Melia azedarach]|uniref:DnaJ domain containing protein n=1 Tax=Melia azedarach TaxID=155640 RepID=A0ACC1XIM9_MELAZ|nr:DnaJ domain containing protein [Melia azedarach]
MECNKDEATRAKEIAEKKFTAKDIPGAKKFAVKAQNLYPGLEGIPQMIATLDVYISAENKINGEADWYGILGVNPQADDETVRKQYRKLALMLHPDKNKSIGADGAFKLISEAWSLLSDKAKRAAYDHKRNGKVFQKVSTTSGGASAAPGANGFYNFTKSSSKVSKSTPRSSHTSTPASSHKSKPNTFWTVCHRCKMQYEYLRVYLNHNLLCPNCHEPFLAVETAPPPSNSTKSPWNFSQQRQNSNHQAGGKNTVNSARNNSTTQNVGAGGFSNPDTHSHTNFQWSPFSRTGGASTAAQAASVVQQAYEKVKRERGEAQAVTKREEALRRKHNVSKRSSGAPPPGYSSSAKRRRGMEDISSGNYGSNVTNQMGTGNAAAAAANVSGNFQTVRVNGITRTNNAKEASQADIQNLLMEKAKMEIRKKINEWKSGTASKTAFKEECNGIEKANDNREKPLVDNETSGSNKSGGSVDEKDGVLGSSRASADAETVETLSINVPDPDFHDFDKDRTEKSFGDTQVWAAYDDDDGMPRYYAMIHSVISLNPFKMRISWLNSRTNSELGPLNWVASGFSKTCGDFRVGRYEISNSLNSFSHKVRWSKGPRGAIRIFPRKGDVWALYRNWSPDWNELTADEVIHKYDMVEVLEDYNEEHGVTVTPLVKVAGFKTVFHQHLDPREVRRIPREEMFRFSHHVPSYLLTGQEAPNAPKGCRELDPAATPVELLQVITDVKEEDILEEEKVEEANDEGAAEGLEKARAVENGNSKDNQDVENVNSKDIRDVESVNSKDNWEVEIVKDSQETDRGGRVDNANKEPVS